MKTYAELIKLDDYASRLRYLSIDGIVGNETFGEARWVNQALYKMNRWKSLRNKIIVRDNGCDLGLEGFFISGPIIVHHINPITLEDVLEERSIVWDPENLISVSLSTHNAIHYGKIERALEKPIIRTPNDTCPWKR